MTRTLVRLSKVSVRSVALVMAALVLARAFVPIGYMVADAGDGVALYLCPEQTPGIYTWLDSDPAHNGHAHHGHHGGSAEPDDVEQSLAPYGEATCMLWANGTHAFTARPYDNAAGLFVAGNTPPLIDQWRAGRRAYRADNPRAPPA
tara:strand:- start:2145 stop:2585 length:441 start_codon:yes stop_codon:yes gene_type:complete